MQAVQEYAHFTSYIHGCSCQQGQRRLIDILCRHRRRLCLLCWWKLHYLQALEAHFPLRITPLCAGHIGSGQPPYPLIVG